MFGYLKIPKISPSKYKQTRNAKNRPLNEPSKYKPPGGLYLEIAIRIQAPPKISPSKRAFEKYKSGGLFSEFYRNYFNLKK